MLNNACVIFVVGLKKRIHHPTKKGTSFILSPTALRWTRRKKNYKNFFFKKKKTA